MKILFETNINDHCKVLVVKDYEKGLQEPAIVIINHATDSIVLKLSTFEEMTKQINASTLIALYGQK